MAARQERRYTAEEVARIVMDIPEHSAISDFEGEGDYESSMDKSNTQSGESDNSASQIEHADIHLQNRVIVIAMFSDLKQQ